MANDEQKKENLLRLTRLSLLGISAGVWDLLGEGAYGLSHEIGDLILPILEKEMGLELAGEDPEQVLQEVGRLMVDEFGFAGDVTVTREGDTLTMKVHTCSNRHFTDQLLEAGVLKPYICPFLCVSDAVLDRMGEKAMTTVEKWEEGQGSILTFELI